MKRLGLLCWKWPKVIETGTFLGFFLVFFAIFGKKANFQIFHLQTYTKRWQSKFRSKHMYRHVFTALCF